jgi:hypothetical protein
MVQVKPSLQPASEVQQPAALVCWHLSVAHASVVQEMPSLQSAAAAQHL